ncbi:hypothetical protein CY35_17G036700 [Sphagnum magellanicum]|jgi:hypothetical protein|nr:hypothetical protein CY35_17G036700 [Sphagnum magellanicum]
MDGVDVSKLLENTFLHYANLNFDIADYEHFVIFFGRSIKQGHYTSDLPINETLGHIIVRIKQHYARCSTDHRSISIEQMYTYQLVARVWHHLLQLTLGFVEHLSLIAPNVIQPLLVN